MTEWISPKEAASILGYSADYFTRFVLKSLEHRRIVGPKGGHRYLVSRRSVEIVIETQKQMAS